MRSAPHKFHLAGLMLACLSVNTVLAEQRPDHYEGKTADTIDAALTNLAETNALIADLVADGDVDAAEHTELHRLTYTTENALLKISEELEALKASLELVHKASEGFDSDTVLTQVPDYLRQSQRLFGR